MNKDINQLLDIMAVLRHPEKGCPWDIEQSFESLSSYTVEEAYEVADAVDLQDSNHLKEELGDLLFQIVFYAQIAQEKGLFSFFDIVKSLNKKMLERHPHVFSDEPNNLNAFEQSKQWEKNKFKNTNKKSVLDDIPKNLPELLKSIKLTKRAAVIGFDWPSIQPVFNKMDEEMEELKQAINGGNISKIKDELGDVIFVTTNLARHLQQDPELALRHANKKFEMRFREVEKQAKLNANETTNFELSYLEKLWEQVKNKQYE